MDKTPSYVIEMLHITKEFPGIKANDDITLQLKKGEIHALLGENGAGKSTLMSVLFGLYQPEAGEIRKNGQTVKINDPNDATALGIGMVHQHFKLVECFSILDNIILGVEPCKNGFLQKQEAREKVLALSEKYGLQVDPDALVEDVTVGMQQRVEILKMLYRDNEILIFDEPTAVLTPQEIDEVLMQLNAGDYLLLQNEIANLTYLLRAAARRGLRVVLNASPISDELLNADLSGVDWLVVNEIECAAMAGCGDAQAGYETLKQRYPSLGILLTLGSEGSVSWKDGTEVRQCAYPVKAVDTTGAGDTFMGYFVGCLAQGMERQTAMQYASMASAISVTRPGAAASIPLMDEVRAAVEAL